VSLQYGGGAIAPLSSDRSSGWGGKMIKGGRHMFRMGTKELPIRKTCGKENIGKKRLDPWEMSCQKDSK